MYFHQAVGIILFCWVNVIITDAFIGVKQRQVDSQQYDMFQMAFRVCYLFFANKILWQVSVDSGYL